MIKVGIVGCGIIAGNSSLRKLDTHAGAFSSIKKGCIQACYDINRSKSLKFSKKINCKVADNIDELVGRYKCNIISICSNDNSHHEVARKILKSKHLPKIIFIEKPPATREGQIKNLVELSKQKKVPIVVNMTRRFDERINKIKKEIKSNKYSRLQSVSVTYYGGLIHNGFHALDMLQYIFENKLKLKVIYNHKKIQKSKIDDFNLFCSLSFSKTNKIVNINYVDDKFYQIFDIDMLFEKYRIQINNFGKQIIISKKYTNKISENVLKIDKKLYRKTKTPMQAAVHGLKNYIEKGNKEIINQCSIEKVAESMQIIWRIKKGIEN